MHRGPQSRDPKRNVRSRPQQTLPSMATPRKPQEPKKSSCLAIIFVFGILGGLVWLLMLIMGWGPYESTEVSARPTLTMIPIIVLRETPEPSPSVTQTGEIITTATPTQTPTTMPSPTQEVMPFILIGEQENLSSALIRPGLGCNWLIIAGQVWDLQDVPLKGLTLHLFGELAGYTIDSFSLTGSATDYGESGYEFTLENLRVASRDSFFIQLMDANGMPLSHPYAIETFEECEKNLLLVNFKQVR